MNRLPILFDEITLLITHYNRSSSLERLLLSFEKLKIRFHAVVVSDDYSNDDHLKKLDLLKERFNLKIIQADKNRGLANNINKGQRMVSSPFTLYVQEDFVPNPEFAERLTDGLALMEEDVEIDLVRFYSHHKHPYLNPLIKGFYEMKFHILRRGFKQFWCYSDTPHLRRSNFLQKFGDYPEGLGSDKAEFKMAISFLQNKGKAIIHEDFRNIFIHENTISEPSQVSRKGFRKYIQSTDFPLLKYLRTIYRNIKFRLKYLFNPRLISINPKANNQ